MTRTWRVLVDDAADRLRASGIDELRQELRWMVESASGLTAAEQTAAGGAPAAHRAAKVFGELVERRVAGEPLQYVLGRWGFRTLDLMVDRRVLIPRAETELVAGIGMELLGELDRTAVVADLGTGSGAIALSLAAERWPRVEVWATDSSPDALAVARANLAGLGRRAASVRLAQGDWFCALPHRLRGEIDLLISNPPYVAEAEPLPPEVSCWEPRDALVAGPTGLEAIEQIVDGARGWLAPGGALVLEIGATQGAAVRELAGRAGFERISIEPDLAGRDRALVAHG